MPRKTLDIPVQVEYLSILEPDGTVDSDLVPDLSDDRLLELYRAMVLGRQFDARQLNLQRQGRIGTFAPVTGQEAAQIGAVAALKKTDWMVPSFRETAAQLFRGMSMEAVLISAAGFNEAAEYDEVDQPRTLPVSVPVGSQMLHACGLAYGSKLKEAGEVAMTFFGDGATSEGDFHEAMNFAGVFELPVIFICQNNQWAISIPRKHQTRSETIAQKAAAYGFEKGIQVDGNDIFAVYAAAKEAVDRARDGNGPTLVECVTYRLQMHTTADDPKRYRKDEEVEEWKEKDPIPRFETYLKDKELLDDEKIESIGEEIKEQINDAVKKAEKAFEKMGDPLDMFNHVYAEMPPRLKAQREWLAAEIEGEEGDNG
jgi:pyruvate dehydrogenase E1 component alpha subunit